MQELTVKLLGYTMPVEGTNPEKIVSAAAKLCYSNSNIQDLMNGLDQNETASFIKMLARLEHESPLEHISFTFGIEGVSRILEQQLTRHRLASYSIQSGRYVKRDPKIVKPDNISENEEVNKIFDDAFEATKQAYIKMIELLENKYIKEGIEKSKAEKQAIEDARFILPNGLQTKIIVTMNARSLINFFEHRCCYRAQDEIRQLANKMLDIVLDIAPNVFNYAGPKCLNGKCKEGKLSCGKKYIANPKQLIKRSNNEG
jgi:thymidylate synthase (FAD)